MRTTNTDASGKDFKLKIRNKYSVANVRLLWLFLMEKPHYFHVNFNNFHVKIISKPI